MSKENKILIVGGVAGGASAAARLRRLDEKAEIILFEKGEYISFANCGLPYYIGGEIKEKSALTLQTPASFNKRFNIDVRVFSEVVSIDRDKKEVTVKDIKSGSNYTETYDKLILSMGAEPIRPPLEGINSQKVFTLRNIPDTYKIKDYIDTHKPKKAAIIGGGYIGIEMAENLHSAGLHVSVIEMQEQVIAPLDYDMARIVENYIKSKGVELLLGTALNKIVEKDSHLELETSKGIVTADMVIMAVGVKPDTILAENCGIELNARKSIIVNEYMQTSDEDIYAVGDAVEVVDFITQQKAMIPLAGPANKQGRIAADNICGRKSTYKGTQGSSILKVFDLTVAATGINEKTAQRLNISYEKNFTLSAGNATYYPGAEYMHIKTLFNKDTGKILGAQLVGGKGVDKRCDVLATVIRLGGSAYDLTQLELCYAPPYSSAKDPVNMAGYAIENIQNGLVKIFHHHDIADLPKDGSVTLLDTRTAGEYSMGNIEGFINIPVDDLRKRYNELDKSKPVYVMCQIGLRGYIACRILEGLGFTCYNLSGGYSLYKEIYVK